MEPAAKFSRENRRPSFEILNIGIAGKLKADCVCGEYFIISFIIIIVRDIIYIYNILLDAVQDSD